MNEATHVQQFEVPPRIKNKETFDNFEKALEANRKAGKKGKKKGGKKKKKWLRAAQKECSSGNFIYLLYTLLS